MLGAAGYSLSEVVKVNCDLRDWGDWDAMNQAYAEHFPKDPPARATVEVGKMAEGLDIEIDCVAWAGGRCPLRRLGLEPEER